MAIQRCLAENIACSWYQFLVIFFSRSSLKVYGFPFTIMHQVLCKGTIYLREIDGL